MSREVKNFMPNTNMNKMLLHLLSAPAPDNIRVAMSSICDDFFKYMVPGYDSSVLHTAKVMGLTPPSESVSAQEKVMYDLKALEYFSLHTLVRRVNGGKEKDMSVATSKPSFIGTWYNTPGLNITLDPRLAMNHVSEQNFVSTIAETRDVPVVDIRMIGDNAHLSLDALSKFSTKAPRRNEQYESIALDALFYVYLNEMLNSGDVFALYYKDHTAKKTVSTQITRTARRDLDLFTGVFVFENRFGKINRVSLRDIVQLRKFNG